MAPPLDISRFESLKASGDLPSPKGVAHAIMRLTAQDDVSMAELARVIRTDPAFVGRLIKAANGIVGYGRRPVASVQDALTVLGMPAVRTMALGFSLMSNYKSGACEAFDYSKYWSACLVAAVTTQAVCIKNRAAAPDETYCLGLLVRVGELALATLYPKEYSAILRECEANPSLDICGLEVRRFGMSHAELGAAMLADWGMPKVFCDAAYHSDQVGDSVFPIGSRERSLTEALMLARTMSELCLAEDAARVVIMNRVLALSSRLDFDEATTIALCDSVAREWVDWGALLNIHAQAMPPFERLAQRAVCVEQGTALPEVVCESAAPPVAIENVSAAPSHLESVVANELQSKALNILLALGSVHEATKLKSLLLGAGYHVAIELDMSMAAEVCLDFEPDIFIVEAGLVDRGGAELLKSIRSTRLGRGMYVVMLGDANDEEVLVSAYAMGVDDVVPQAASSRLLLARLEAGKRVTSLHSEIERDREEIRHFAAELAVSNRRLQEVAMMDVLTGFPNRRFFSDRLMQEWASSTRHKRPLSCVMMDVDNFRALNDAYGHEIGDAVLRQIAQAMRGALRAHDVVARTGGNEFLVMCPDTALEAAQVCAERMRSAVEEAQIVCGVLHLKMTISVGLASRDASIADTEALLRRAEQGIELAKQSGRNRVVSPQLRPQAAGA